VRTAVLFGSFALGQESRDSDIDLLVWLRDPGAVAVAGIAGRLTDRLGREVQLVRLKEAERSPVLMADVLAQGRVLIDRDELWLALKGTEQKWLRRVAESNAASGDSMPDLELLMAAAPAPAAPLEATDRDRARALKAKIRDRISDVRRHLIALRTVMGEFGEDFDLDAFQHAYDSADPVELNQVKAVERGVDQLYNYIAELTAFGLELAEVRQRRDDTNARTDIDALARLGVIGPERARRLQRLRELRRQAPRRVKSARVCASARRGPPARHVPGRSW
jgi:predicted nucleotidyltransferase